MRYGKLEGRRYSLDDQREFARLSGDWNPLHVDPIAARRTMFGEPLVHGVHLLVWALERWIGDSPTIVIDELRATFRKPAHLGVPLELEAIAIDDGAKLRVISPDGEALDATVKWHDGAHAGSVPSTSYAPEAPVELSRDAVASQAGSVALALDIDAARGRFPNALRALGARTLADLLATTRVVGMQCPGLHSIFGGLALRACVGDETLAYRIGKANMKYSMLDIEVTGATLQGTLSTFYRPSPQPGPTSADVASVVRAGEFAGQRALIVGGSRGLGEALARCLAHGGADVCITYHRGASDAQSVVREAGGRIEAIQLDVTGDVRIAWPFSEPPTHLYYLATPRIPAVRKLTADELETMMRYYVTAFYAVVEATVAQARGEVVVWTPSTVFLDTGTGAAAYTIAKAAMEELCRRLPNMLPVRVRAPRLPRIATDQTVGLVQLPAASALDVALAELRALAI